MTTSRRLLLIPLIAALSMVLLTGGGPVMAVAPPVASVAAYPPLSPADYPPTCGHHIWTPDDGGMACFNPTGEHLFICDRLPDGAHVTVWWQGNHDDIPTGSRNYDGNRTCIDANFDMDEDESIRYTVCVYDNDRPNYASCSKRTGWISAKG